MEVTNLCALLMRVFCKLMSTAKSCSDPSGGKNIKRASYVVPLGITLDITVIYLKFIFIALDD